MTEFEMLMQEPVFQKWLMIAIVGIPLLFIWCLVWKAWGLWRAAKNDSKLWFVILLLVHTLGLLDILYIFLIGRKKKGKVEALAEELKEKV